MKIIPWWLDTPAIPLVDAPRTVRVGVVYIPTTAAFNGRYVVAERGIRMPVYPEPTGAQMREAK